MNAPTLIVDPTTPDAATIDRAASVLREGGLVAFPTETVYGLGAAALQPEAVRRIFGAKGRPAYNPVIVHVPDVAAAVRVVAEWPPAAQKAAAAFWPGPLTLVLARAAGVPDEVTAGLDTVAVRVPAHPVALALLRAADLPVAAPSANRFTRVSPTTAAHVARGLGDRVDLILDGGVTPVGIESTVLDLSRGKPRLLRRGAISSAEIEAVLGPVEIAVSPRGRGGPLPAPGMLDRHYSPDAHLVVFDDRDQALSILARTSPRGLRAGALLIHESLPDVHQVIAMPRDARGYARLLYASLHALDDAGCDVILVEPVPDGPDWDAVRDRLRRAARPIL